MFDAVFGLYLLASIACSAAAAWRLVSALVRRCSVSADWEIRTISTAVLMSCAIVGVVEAASLFKAVSSFGLGTVWFIAAGLLFQLGRKIDIKAQSAGEATEAAQDIPESPRREQRILRFSAILLLLILFLLAVLTPPTSWDSLTYHLPRVLNWIQNGSVAHFATHDTRQVESGPFAAYAVMQLFLVTHNDRLVNLVQWIAMVLSGIGVSWLALQFYELAEPAQDDQTVGRGGSVKAWTLFFAVTMPVGIVQAITTQTDYVVALWVVSTAVFGFLLWKRRGSLIYAGLFGASIGLGTLTKATMVVTAGLLSATLLCLALAAASSHATRLRVVLVTALAAAFVVTPHFARNLRTFGSPLGSRYIYALMRNEYQSPSVWVSNFVRNLSLHAASGIPPVTSAVNSFLKTAHSLSGRDDNDRATTFFTSTFSYITGNPVSDNSAGNFWHGTLALLSCVYAAIKFPRLRKYVAALFGIVFMTFAAQNGYLRWSEWNARFHLPFFLLLAPVVGVAIARSPAPLRLLSGLVLGVVAFHAAFYNKSRPVLGENEFLFQDRERQYFIEVPNLFRPSLNAATDVIASGSTNVGLRMYKNFFRYLDEMEYPFWVMLRNRGFDGRIYNVGVSNETARLSNSVPIQALISSVRGPKAEVAHLLPFRLQYPPIDVYFAEPTSHWIQVAQLQTDGSEQPFTASPDIVELADNAGVIACRVARQGVLTLNAAILRGDSPVETPTSLFIRTFAGYAHASQSTNGRHSVEIPLPPSQTAIQLGVPGSRDPVLKLPIQWTWQPTNAPLQFVFISRIFDPTNAASAMTNALVLSPGQARTIQLVSGAPGDVRLSFYATETNRAEFKLEGGSLSTNLSLRDRVTTADVPVDPGTNQFTISNRSDSEISLDSVDAVFR